MALKTYMFGFLFTFLALFQGGVTQGNVFFNLDIIVSDDPLITPPAWLNSSAEEFDKFIQDKYNYFITTQGNKMWVASMNLAWN